MLRPLKIAAAMALVLAAAPLGAAAPKPNIVTIKGFKFTPQLVTVPVGTSVTWTNADNFQHRLQATNGEFQSPRLDYGKTYTVNFPKPGTYPYYCGIHPSMTGRVVVTP